jgi:hypothetical protein
MNNCPEPAPANEWRFNEAAAAADLELPVDAEFVSEPPRLDPQAMLRRIEETMPWREQVASAGVSEETVPRVMDAIANVAIEELPKGPGVVRLEGQDLLQVPHRPE